MSKGAAAAKGGGNQLPLPRAPLPHVQWHWATPQAESVLMCGDLGAVLRFHRQIHGLSQTALGNLLGYDKTYVSMVENGRRTIDDVPSRRRIAATLRLPPHVLGVTDPTDADHAAMLQFGESTVRLAEIARQSGHASEAVAELWPLVTRLEARVANGHTEREVLILLARARVGLGVALGHVLPEEKLPIAARWTGQGLAIARHLGDPAMSSYALRMHGNELRKARLIGVAVDRLRQAVATAPSDEERAAALTLLARAAGELGHSELFDEALRGNRDLIERVAHTSLVNPFALREVQLRGLLKTGRAQGAVQLIDEQPPTSYAITPQWRVIEHVTAGSVLLRRGDRTGADDRFSAAVTDATAHRLPHQLQRVIRITGHTLPDVRERAEQALSRVRQDMAA